jgi:hypothetical protein
MNQQKLEVNKNGTFFNGRLATFEIDFDDSDTFGAYRKAEAYCNEFGYSTGSISSPLPTAIKKGDYHVAKWKNLTRKEIESIDGVILADSFREGPVKLLLFQS